MTDFIIEPQNGETPLKLYNRVKACTLFTPEFALDIFFRFDRIDFREVKYLRNHSDYYITTNDDTEAHITIHKKGSEKTLMI